jgi:hypothetical protein
MIKKKDRKPRHEDLAKRKVWDNKLLMLLVYTGPKKERKENHTGAPSNKVKRKKR